MKLTLTANTGIDIIVWRDGETFNARRAAEAIEPQICLGVDLFEVVAELAGLDLDDTSDTAEAVRLANDARLRLQDAGADGRVAGGPSNEEDWRRSS